MRYTDWTREKVNKIIKNANSNNPYKLCDFLRIHVDYADLGKDVLGLRTVNFRIPTIILSTRNSDQENYVTLAHELGHHICKHDTNTEYLKRHNLNYKTYGVEYEANKVMIDILTYNTNIAEFHTQKDYLNYYSIPNWAKRYVDWNYLKENANFNTFDSVLD